MLLDQPEKFAAIDPQHMLDHIDALPDQLANAWAHAQQQDLPAGFRQARMIVLTGMGGSAIGGDYLAALVEDQAPLPVLVNRGYSLPAFVRGPEVLVIASSHSGNTEETLAAFDEARARGVKLMALSTGGALAAKAREAGVPLWSFTYDSQPRAAFGWSFGLLVGLAHRLGLAGDLSADVKEAVDLLRQSRDQSFNDSVPIHQNAPKRYAGQICGRIGVAFGAGLMAPVARRWKGQINENAKNWAEFDVLPEQNHNGVAGIDNPDKALERLFVFFLQSSYDHPRVALRHKLTYQLFMQEGIGVDTFTARGKSRLAQMMNATQFGDYLSYYLAMLNGADPTPIPPISMLKEGLAQA